jgi:GNAT superfamily N-acetyltransferase
VASVVPYRDDLRPHFERLNVEWIERWFQVEEPDREVFRDPRGSIITPGGQIIFVVEGEAVQGTCALVRRSEDEFELAKMAVAPEARGRGYGDLLMEAAIAWTREAGGRRLVLVSNTRLAPALALYRKHGFVEVPLDDAEGYQRANIKLAREL